MPAQAVKKQKLSKEETGKKHEEKSPAMQDVLVPEGTPPMTDLQRAVADPRTARSPEILALQRKYGNDAVQRLLVNHNLQAKLTVGAANDAYEQEADHIAAQVLSTPAQAPAIQRQGEEEEEIQTKPLAASITPLIQRQPALEEEELQARSIQRQAMPEEEEELLQGKFIQRQAIPEEEEELLQGKFIQRQAIPEEDEEKPLQGKLIQRQPELEEEEVQTKSTAAGGSFAPSADFESRLAATRGSGRSLPKTTRDFMEQRFGADFSGVRVHIGSESAHLNTEVSAQAFTRGQDVYLGEGKENVESSEGKRLLAHELTHVVQQLPLLSRKLQQNIFIQKSSQGKVVSENKQVLQRRAGATPVNYRVSDTSIDNDKCSISHGLMWDSTDNDRNHLDDYLTREHITFSTDPRTPLPAYNGPLPFGMVLAGNVLTKTIGMMDRPGGRDEHSGACNGPAFTVGGAPNLQQAAWTLVGTQYYQYSNDNGATWNNILGPFTITRQMQSANGQYQLTIQKNGPGLNLQAGPTKIYNHLTSEAMTAVGSSLPDQTGAWTAAQTTLTNLGLHFVNIATDNAVVNAHPVQIDYEKADPIRPMPANMAQYVLPAASQGLILAQAQHAVNSAMGQMTNIPPHFVVTIVQGTPVQQQAFQTNAAGGTYRIILRADKIMDTTQHMMGSIPGSESQRGWTPTGKKERYAKAVVTHEMGHLMHGFANPDKYKIATMSMMNLLPADPTHPDPLRSQKEQISRINTDVMLALNGRHYAAQWGYAKNPMQANPAEVVAETFTALMHNRTVPRGMAAVYIAYGGVINPTITAQLNQIFGGRQPDLSQAQYAIPIINQDP